jgi:hypothetical protein
LEKKGTTGKYAPPFSLLYSSMETKHLQLFNHHINRNKITNKITKPLKIRFLEISME